jgi:hypothetical protein
MWHEVMSHVCILGEFNIIVPLIFKIIFQCKKVMWHACILREFTISCT